MMPSFCNTIHRVARKQHRCCECLGTIEPADVYERVTGCWDGSMATFKTCLHCETARDDLIIINKEYDWYGEDGAMFCFEGLEEELHDAMGEVRKPGEAFKLGRHIVGMRKRRSCALSVPIMQTGGTE